MILALQTKSCCFRRMNSLRTIRAKLGMDQMLMASMALKVLTPSIAMISMASRMPGKVNRRSMTRMMGLSSRL